MVEMCETLRLPPKTSLKGAPGTAGTREGDFILQGWVVLEEKAT